ncbi:MAG TPA: PqqD family protein [Kiritimatiellae bacterium]|nr:PqqD family protein [Kiritimatiellia bacterium]
MTEKDPRYRRAASAVKRCVAGEVFLVPVAAGVADVMSLYVLNPTAEVIWDLLDEPRSLNEICEHIQQVTGEAGGHVREDCSNFLTQMERMGLVERA